MKVNTVGVVASAPSDGRVPLVPDGARRLAKTGLKVVVEAGSGEAAAYGDEAYEAAGATPLPRPEVVRAADVLLTIDGPAEGDLLPAGRVVVGLLSSRSAELTHAGATAVVMERLPRTLSRCQAMDVLTSQAGVAGYRAAIVGAATYGRYFPMLITAAGTSRPARVLVIGAGVAGLSAIGTSRRLGAVVTGYDVRPETRGEVESLGARFLELESVKAASGEGGYARALTEEEQRAQQDELEGHLPSFDIVITTAAVPGRRPPLLLPARAVDRLSRGAVVVDMGSGPLGGNVEGSQPGMTVTAAGGALLVGAANLAASAPGAASDAFSSNMVALLGILVNDGELVSDPDDEVLAAIVERPSQPEEGADERVAAV